MILKPTKLGGKILDKTLKSLCKDLRINITLIAKEADKVYLGVSLIDKKNRPILYWPELVLEENNTATIAGLHVSIKDFHVQLKTV